MRRCGGRCPTRCGFGIVELVVAMSLLAVGMLALAAAATAAAHRIGIADARERATRVTAILADSLLAAPRPAAGQRLYDGVPVRWTIGGDAVLLVVDLEADVRTSNAAMRTVRHRAVRLR
jgi:Tfp pilus assembly protein PilV